jgi:hypothetical protein
MTKSTDSQVGFLAVRNDEGTSSDVQQQDPSNSSAEIINQGATEYSNQSRSYRELQMI